MGWARTYLKKAGLVEAPRRGFVKITARGVEVLQQKPKAINKNLLIQYPEFVEFQNNSKPTKFNCTTNDDWPDDLEENDWKEEELEEQWNSDLESHQFSASICTMRKELWKLVINKNETQHTLLVEGEEHDIVITCLVKDQKLVSIWNRSTALAIAEAI